MIEDIKSDDQTKVVYIDDDIEAGSLFQNAFTNFRAVDLRQPNWDQDLEQAIDGAELIITDWHLDGMVKKGLYGPGDGKALNEVIRAKHRKKPENPLYTIFSGKLDNVPDFEHHSDRPHILTQDLDADWVGSKDKGVEFRRQLLLLCHARRELRGGLREPEAIAASWRSLFSLGADLGWSDEALNDIERFQPPVHHLFGPERDERTFLRWMTRLVFPYPTFLLDGYEVAIRLRLHPKKTATLLADDSSALSRALTPVQYRGVLAGFDGKRWWRAGLGDWLWERTGGNPYDRERVRQSLRDLAGDQVTFLEERDPVLMRDERGRPMEDDLVADAADAVRIQPDEWPASVPWPWTRISMVLKDPLLHAIVLPDDQHVVTRKR